ncbi:NAD-dependent glycerol-3-phosphate dehydrogenase C-terminus-domain-containing protein [Syncephalis plumigaleata]|nr:NAD-dependent glycerol-3-phosphate dehydrogenase C-terminus-domain-containing protein [Syncephalis plumigaleata]
MPIIMSSLWRISTTIQYRNSFKRSVQRRSFNLSSISPSLLSLIAFQVKPSSLTRTRTITRLQFPFHSSVSFGSLSPITTTTSLFSLRSYTTTSSINMSLTKERVCIIGSGNWGSAIAKIVGRNVVGSTVFEEPINMWVFEELIDVHENVRYLPGIKLPNNIHAVPDLRDAVKDATILIFVVPHQFVEGICNQLRAISLIKGVDVKATSLSLISDLIAQSLSIDVSVLMGANIANEVARDKFCETTVGCRIRENGDLFRQLFNTPYFRVNVVEDVAGVELCGALKNIVAIGAGLADGLDYGDNTKAALVRIGLMEMKKFARMFYKGDFFESCGVADLITTCSGGRNRRVAEAHARTNKPFEQLEREMLNGQKLQGTSTARELHEILEQKNLCHEFPLFTTIYEICYEGLPASRIVENI